MNKKMPLPIMPFPLTNAIHSWKLIGRRPAPPGSCTKRQMKSGVQGGGDVNRPRVLFTFQCHPSVKQPASPSWRDYAASPLCSPHHIFSSIWAPPLSSAGGAAEEPSCVFLDYHERGQETEGKVDFKRVWSITSFHFKGSPGSKAAVATQAASVACYLPWEPRATGERGATTRVNIRLRFLSE